MKTVVFACVHSAGRSQMAAAWLNRLADPSVVRGVAAGTDPAADVHPEVVAAMHEVGVDLSRARPRKLTAELASGADLLVTMGCGEQCPVVPGLARLDWSLADPKGQSADAVRAIRDDIAARVAALVRDQGWQRPDLVFRILYCHPCGYRGRADGLADELRNRYGARVTVEEGGFGQFDVFLNGGLIASKGGFFKRMLVHGAPPQAELLAAIARALADQEGDACELPPGGTAGRP